MMKTKLCKDCRHYKERVFDSALIVYSRRIAHECARKRFWKKSEVTGEDIFHGFPLDALEEREPKTGVLEFLKFVFGFRPSSKNCGPEGKYWEAKDE